MDGVGKGGCWRGREASWGLTHTLLWDSAVLASDFPPWLPRVQCSRRPFRAVSSFACP